MHFVTLVRARFFYKNLIFDFALSSVELGSQQLLLQGRQKLIFWAGSPQWVAGTARKWLTGSLFPRPKVLCFRTRYIFVHVLVLLFYFYRVNISREMLFMIGLGTFT